MQGTTRPLATSRVWISEGAWALLTTSASSASLGWNSPRVTLPAGRPARLGWLRAVPLLLSSKNTVSSMQSGLVYGYVGLVDGIVERMRAEVDFPLKVIATGGLAPLIAKDSRTIEECDEMLTLTGLRLIYEREQRRSSRA